jgi:lipopolysaccharide export system protein LptA
MFNADTHTLKRRVLFLAFLAFFLTPLLLPALASAKGKQKPTPPNKATATRMADNSGKVRIAPTIPSASRAAGNRVILERAEVLHKEQFDSFMIVSGDVKFSKGPMKMYCDSAHYAPNSGSFNAFGNVHMEQGDTLFVYGDELNYDGTREIAYLYSYLPTKPVRLINRDVKLETDIFTYDLYNEYGYYNTGGVLTDKKNRLTSVEGEYIPSTKEANFYTNVYLKSLSEKDTLDIYTDTMYYNTNSHLAEFFSPTRIYNGQGVIYSTDGSYNTETDKGELYSHSRVVMNRGTTLEGDTLFYDRKVGIGEAFGNMVLVDSAKQSTLRGNYGFYNEIQDSAYVTGRALAMEYSQGDTLYMHGRYITSIMRIDTATVLVDSVPTLQNDSTHVLTAWPRVRFYRSDMQGLCDSMNFIQKDSMLYMHRHPIVWSDDRQIFGNLIKVHLNDSTVDRAELPDFGFSAQKLEDDIYNQLCGKTMVAYFDGKEMRQVDVSGSVQAIFFPEENDSTINKIVSVESSFLTAWMKNKAMERLKMWPETTGKATPLYLAKRSMLWLPKFAWYESLRPKDPDDVFVVSEEMEALMNESEDSEGSATPMQASPVAAPAAPPSEEIKSDE